MPSGVGFAEQMNRGLTFGISLNGLWLQAVTWTYDIAVSHRGPQPRRHLLMEAEVNSFMIKARGLSLKLRGPKDHISTRVLQNMISGIPLILSLGTRM